MNADEEKRLRRLIIAQDQVTHLNEQGRAFQDATAATRAIRDMQIEAIVQQVRMMMSGLNIMETLRNEKKESNQVIACNHDGIYFSDGEPHCDDCGY